MSEDDEHPLYKEFHAAARLGDLELVKTILSKTDVNINGAPRKATALHHAAENGQEQVVQLLLDWNAEIEIKGGSFDTTPLYYAVAYNHLNCAKILLDRGANVNAYCYRGSVLQVACCNGYKEIIDLLVYYGADVNSPSQLSNSCSEGALHAAAQWAHEEIVHMLLEKGAEVNVSSGKGESALMLAVGRVDTPKIRLLLQYGAKIDRRVLDIAVTRRHEKTLHTLLEASISAFDVDCNYELALETITTALKKATPLQVENNRPGCTVNQVRSVWENGLSAYKYPWRRSPRVDRWKKASPDERTRAARIFGVALIKRASSPASHFEELDVTISRNTLPGFWALPIRAIMKRGLDDSGIINRACKLLSQLPSTPPPLFSIKLAQDTSPSEAFDKDFFVDTRTYSTPHWDELKVTSLTSALVIQVALLVSCSEMRHVEWDGLLQFFGEVLNTLFEMPLSEASQFDKDACFIAKSFIWTAWQQIRLLLTSYQFQDQLEKGLSYESPGVKRALEEVVLSSRVIDSVSLDQQTPPYMCKWAYRVISTTNSAAISDLRRLILRYTDLWGEQMGRCNDNHCCSGNSSDECLRFQGAIIADQSAHDPSCEVAGPCYRIYWDRSSYQNIGGRASVRVDSDISNGKYVIYCEASERTLAISHVWAHGQGGRPETGINCCLHRRYCAIARSLDCDSYWIDTMCIPDNHVLRGKAIMSINSIFQDSKACLVCDRDVMEIDISDLGNGKPSTRAQILLRESILSTIIFSDWNVRAWTLLEAMQSREKIMFLCKHNRIFSLRENLEIVMTQGSLDIGTAFLKTPHLLPQPLVELVQPTTDKTEENAWLDELDSALDDEPEDNKKLEEAAACLKHRPASREGDAFVIWTILADAPTLRSPEEFWRSRKGTLLSTGFLMSEVSRVKAKGLSWAPSDPTACKIPSLLNRHTGHYHKAEMMVTDKGEIRNDGFSAFWQVFHLEPWARRDGESLSEDAAFARDIREAVRSHFSTRNKIVLLQPALRTKRRIHTGKLITETKGSVLPVVAICEYCPDDNGWKWLGVRTLDLDGYLPEFLSENILLV